MMIPCALLTLIFVVLAVRVVSRTLYEVQRILTQRTLLVPKLVPTA